MFVVEALIGGVTVIALGAMRLARHVADAQVERARIAEDVDLNPIVRARRDAIEYKRRILERQRAEQLNIFDKDDADGHARAMANDMIDEIDKQLVKLGDELAAVYDGVQETKNVFAEDEGDDQ